ncbi:succinate dehydrogenase, hydrophobic membrane anchor protein [Allopusillimonas ginsengisoli]|uniref:succinate dehydrogenase, hydrophobic membrane anchor protein n=1 Tax=Allopusillimonas ginsengisoli TaxID=453575 RepID=UPI001021456B|nr:succinate dehydrogenase, hydrophobic membrane anchor protein [Allopusillimonas ginsengisoli]TEA78480.1 succinate dehydrogenase, hydrophobic membrane anchor protein [Allopusillimonas ginsengisoli]
MAQELLGTKRLVVGAHYGTLDFIVQRVTAVIMAIYTVVLFLGFLFTPTMDFESWRGMFSFTCIGLPVGQLLATLAFLSVAWHAWVGVRDIWMDYVRSAGLRLFLQVLTILWLVASVVFFAKIIWSL